MRYIVYFQIPEMLTKFLIKLLSILILSNLAFNSVYAAKATVKKNIESAEIEDEDSEDEEYMDEESELEFEFNGFIDFENIISSYKDQEQEEANKKNELRNNAKFKFGNESFQLKVDMNLYINSNVLDDSYNEDYIYARNFEASRNLRLSDSFYEVSFNELYINYGEETFRIRAGNQIYGWGTADGLNPTSYFNPQDSRELLFKDDDEAKMAIPSISGIIFIGDYTLELIFVPIHVPMLMAEKDTFWAIKYWEGPFPVIADKPEGLEKNATNFGYGGKFSLSFSGADFSISGYHGPDVEPAMRPVRTLITPLEPVSLLVKSEYGIANYMGFDFTKSMDTFMGGFVIQAEAAFSPDKTGVVDPGNLDEIEDPEEIRFPFEIKKDSFLAYSIGFNYFIPLNKIIEGHEGETVFTFEWHEAFFFDNNIMQPVLSDVLTCKLQDSYFSNYLNISLTCIVDTTNKGLIFLPNIGLDLQNGFTVHISYGYIKDFNKETDSSAASQSMFSFYKDNDVVIVGARYEY